MYKLYPILKCFWEKINTITTSILITLVFVSFLKEGKVSFSTEAFQWLLSPSVYCTLLLFFLIPAVLMPIAKRSERKRKQRSSFDLCKPVRELVPEDLEFIIFSRGMSANPGERPYYEGYVSRTYRSVRQGDQENKAPTTEPEVLERIRGGSSMLIVGQPTEGKTRSAYELLKGLSGFDVISIRPDRSVPKDAFGIIKDKNVVIFVDDLDGFIGRQSDLNTLYTEVKNVAKQCVILATCRSGPELNQIAHPTSNLNRFYERFDYELLLVRANEDQNQEAADMSGVSLTPQQLNVAPTLGWVMMNDARMTMEGRFKGLSSETKDVLYALKLLRFAGVGPPTRQRVRNVLEAMFLHSDTHLNKALGELAENAFIELPTTQEPIQPEEAYLRYVVPYAEGKHIKDDIAPLGKMLNDTRDAEGLHHLAITLAMAARRYSEAIRYIQQATQIKEEFHEAYYSLGLTLYEAGNELVGLQQSTRAGLSYEAAERAYRRALDINPNYYQAWNNLGIIYNRFGEYSKAVEAYDKAIKIRTNPATHKAWYNKGLARCRMNLPEEYERAVTDFRKAIRLKTDYHQALDNLAHSLIILEQYKDALKAIETARQLVPDKVEYWATYGIALSHIDREDAIIWLCKAWRVRTEVYNVEATEKQLRSAFTRLKKSPDVCR